MSLKPKSCDHQSQSYIGTFLSKELSLVTRPNALDDPKKFLHINLENFVVLTRSLYPKNGLRYHQSYYIPCLVISHDQNCLI